MADIKQCARCKEKKLYRAFTYNRHLRTYFPYCKICANKAANIQRYGQQRHKVNSSKQKYERKRRNKRQQWIFEYLLKHPCEDCKEDNPIVLDFDHVKGKKSFHISRALNLGYSIKTILKEIAKCKVRCSNCHRKQTAKRQKWTRYILYKRYKKGG